MSDEAKELLRKLHVRAMARLEALAQDMVTAAREGQYDMAATLATSARTEVYRARGLEHQLMGFLPAQINAGVVAGTYTYGSHAGDPDSDEPPGGNDPEAQ